MTARTCSLTWLWHFVVKYFQKPLGRATRRGRMSGHRCSHPARTALRSALRSAVGACVDVGAPRAWCATLLKHLGPGSEKFQHHARQPPNPHPPLPVLQSVFNFCWSCAATREFGQRSTTPRNRLELRFPGSSRFGFELLWKRGAAQCASTTAPGNRACGLFCAVRGANRAFILLPSLRQ